MKRVYVLFCLSIFLCITFAAFAQAPQSFNYQSVVRNANGAVVSNQAVKLRLSITDAASGGNILYRESHSLTTNQFGLVIAAVGGGIVLNGSFAAINWGAGSRYLQVEVDPTGGNTFADMGTAQLLSVPYALYAETSGNGAVGPTGAVGATGPTGAQGVIGATGATGTSGQAGDRYTTTSSTSLSISSGAKTLTVGTGLSYAVGQTVIIANSATNVMTGTVTAYNSTTGAMSVTVTSVTGSGTFTSWTVALNGAPGPAGPTGVGATGPTGATGATGTFGVTGTTGQTIRHNGTAWVATSNLYNNGASIGIGTTSPSFALEVVGAVSTSSTTNIVNNISGGQSGSAATFNNSGSRSISNSGVIVNNLTTKSGGSNSTKVGLEVNSTGSWAPSSPNQPNVGVKVTASGADNNYGIQLIDGSQGANKLLTSDNLGRARWSSRIISGKVTVTSSAPGAGANKKTQAITFGTTFTNAANVRVIATPRVVTTDAFLVTAFNVTTSGCTLNIYRADAPADTGWGTAFEVHWIAFEEE